MHCHELKLFRPDVIGPSSLPKLHAGLHCCAKSYREGQALTCINVDCLSASPFHSHPTVLFYIAP